MNGLTLRVDLAKHLSCDSEPSELPSNVGFRHRVAGFFGIGGSSKKEEDRA